MTLAAVVLLISNTGRLNSALSDSPGHGRVVPTATDRHFLEQGIPNGTGGISSIFTDHLDTEAIRPSWVLADELHRRAKVSGTLGYALFTYIISAENWDVNAKETHEEFVHTRQLVSAAPVYLLLLPKYCLLRGRTANSTKAPIAFYDLHCRFFAVI